jgi:hypothetical protein
MFAVSLFLESLLKQEHKLMYCTISTVTTMAQGVCMARIFSLATPRTRPLPRLLRLGIVGIRRPGLACVIQPR